MRDGRMHQTTIRFSFDLWEALEDECGRLGVSAAQYLREAALTRLTYSAGKRGDADYEHALVRAGAAPVERHSRDLEAREMAAERVLAASAVSAQSQLARRRSEEVREHSAELRRRRREMKT